MARQSKSGKAAAKSARAGKSARKRKTTTAAKPKPRTAVKAKRSAEKKLAKANPRSKGSTKAKTAQRAAKPHSATRAKAKAKPRVLRASAKPRDAHFPQSLMARLEAQALKVQTGRDWSATLFLPKTHFPMKAGLPEREPELLKRWGEIRLYDRLREEAMGRPKFIIHDGPPYANGNIHIGTGLNKILKDVINRSQAMMGKDANYVPGWDCHGLPIEWKVEEENYRAKGKAKPDLSDSAAMIAFRAECRAYAQHWLNVQREEFKRLGVEGDWQHPYTTMSFPAEAQIARELMKFAANGTLYRGSKPVMWSVVEKTALAEAEVEYEDYVSDQVWVKFPVRTSPGPNRKLADAALVIWTTTPWTIPGNRAISYSPKIAYGLYEVVDAPAGNWAKPGERLVLADKLAADVFQQARVTAHNRLGDVPAADLAAMVGDYP